MHSPNTFSTQNNNLLTWEFWRKNWRLALLLVFAIILIFVQVGPIRFFQRAATARGSLQFTPAQISAQPNQQITVPVILNTDTASVRGVDVFISFNPSHVTVVDILPQAQQTTPLKTFLPTVSNTFDKNTVIQRANSTGKLLFSAVTYDSSANGVTEAYKGSTILANVVLKPVQSTTINFDFIIGSTKDSNIVDKANPPEDVLTSVTNLSITVLGTSPAPTPSTGPTVAPTRIPTLTPISPTPSRVPTTLPGTPTIGPTSSLTITPTVQPNCSLKSKGDADCNGAINEIDYVIWKCEIGNNGICNTPATNKAADFNTDGKINVFDFEIWRKNR
jgi:hypothetical protein